MLQLNYNLLTCTLGLVQTARLVHDLDAEARGRLPPHHVRAILGQLMLTLRARKRWKARNRKWRFSHGEMRRHGGRIARPPAPFSNSPC